MHAAVRTYRVNDVETLVSRVEAEFAPRVKALVGIIGYYVIDGGDGNVASVTVGETAEAVDASTSAAADWVRANAAELIDGPAIVTAGEVRVRAER
jgi:hypothetical protein